MPSQRPLSSGFFNGFIKFCKSHLFGGFFGVLYRFHDGAVSGFPSAAFKTGRGLF